ncbi:MAG: hypothetical protein ABWW69_07630 [Pyrodictiaceae archaeon]
MARTLSLLSNELIDSLCINRLLGSKRYCRTLLKKLWDAGYRELVSYGRLSAKGVNILGKGWSSIVFLVRDYEGNLWAVKARREVSRRPTLLREALYLVVAGELGIAPRTVAVGRDYIVEAPLLGGSLTSLFESGLEDEAILCSYLVRRILWKLYLLDRLGIRHNELARPENHILLDCNGEPYIVDFESATIGGKPTNIPQFFGALIAGRLKLPCIGVARSRLEEVRFILRDYKLSPRLQYLQKIIDMILGE